MKGDENGKLTKSTEKQYFKNDMNLMILYIFYNPKLLPSLL